MSSFILFGIGSPLVVEYLETCHRRGDVVVAGVSNHPAPHQLGDATTIVDVRDLTPQLTKVACLVPLFTPCNRLTAVAEAVRLGFEFSLPLVDPTAVLAGDVEVGSGSFINAGAIVGACTVLGEHVVVNRGGSVGHHVEVGDFASVGPGAIIAGNVTIGRAALIGAGAIILPGLSIGEDCVIGAGAVVTKSVPPGSKMLGLSARRAGASLGGSETFPLTGQATEPRTHLGPVSFTDAPMVSVVIKSYNHAKYIRQTLQSVLSQSFQDFEIIVTDDGSTDGTPDVVRQFIDPRIKLEVNPVNTGVSLTMNSACARARGKYIATLNSDDYALPDRLLTQVAYLEQRPEAGAVFTAVEVVAEDGKPSNGAEVLATPLSWTDYERPRWLRQFFTHGNCLAAPSAMIRRAVLSRIGQYDPRLTNLQDLDMWVRLATSSDIGFIPERLTAFRIRSGARNLSAGRPDTLVRSQFEYAMILRRYADMDAAMVRAIFHDHPLLLDFSTDKEKRLFLAEAALSVGSAPHKMFALETYFSSAASLLEYNRLRDITGEVDVFRYLSSIDPPSYLTGSFSHEHDSPLHVAADGRFLGVTLLEDTASVLIPAGTQSAYLRTPVRWPNTEDEDQRSLGVFVVAVELTVQGEPPRSIDLADPAFDGGFHQLEGSGPYHWRWSRPNCLLPRQWYMGLAEDCVVRLWGRFDPFGLSSGKSPAEPLS